MNNLAPHICLWCKYLNRKIEGQIGTCKLKKFKVPIEKYNNCKDWQFEGGWKK